MAAALVLGATVLDVGCGEAGLESHLAPSVRYTGLDRTSARMTRHGSTIWVGDALDLLGGAMAEKFDTVVCLEFIEHIDPAQQENLIGAMWMHTQRRLIVSSPDPDAKRRYPQTDHFYGSDNPHHTRELTHHWLRRTMAHHSGVYSMQVFEHGLDSDDLPTWGHGPAAGWMAVIDR